jgi:hypothetical protein
LLEILKFSEPYYFLALRSLFGAPCSKKEQKMLFAGLLLEHRFLSLGPRGFFSLGFRFWGPWTVWGLALFGSRAKTGNKKIVRGPALWGLDF